MSAESLKEQEFQRLIELALQLAKKDNPSDNYTLEDVRKTANELGISQDKINKALQILEDEKKEKVIRQHQFQKQFRVWAKWIVAIVVAGLIYYYFSRPVPPFNGVAKVNLSTVIDTQTNLAENEVEKVELFKNNKLYAYIKLMDAQHSHTIKWELYSPGGHLYDKQSLKMPNTPKDIWTGFATFNFPMNTKLGDWKVVIYADSKPIAERVFKVEWGNVKISMAAGLDRSKKPINISDEFSKANTSTIYCYLDWDLLVRTAEIKWRWKDNKGNLITEETFKLTPSGTAGYWAYDDLSIKDLSPGKYTVELWIENVKFNEKVFFIR